ncbi:DUF3499 domain-containing protein [Aeromicrobium piscarium]|uniref:DUF3499 domain-containing protein n=1 Tax=Aeromicrobium piscarium TaxID=2590901 RepID=A0A554SB87_9ACTN|nr:DUF3499 domain-containing protein [Aeromicrobium piscarium]TSD63610.1 DUF3499 domain-containing protein [Aeromicrobium piscarium]
MGPRRCTRTGCSQAAVATLTYDYGDSVVILGPLATYAEPHSYDLCAEHATRLSAPQGWQVVRLASATAEPPEPSVDDLVALAEAVREVGTRPVTQEPAEPSRPPLRLVRPDHP